MKEVCVERGYEQRRKVCVEQEPEQRWNVDAK
jgi:hypothetical protein